MALYRPGINVSLGLLVIPLLVAGLPYLPLAALATGERLIQIKLRQAPVGVDVGKPAVVGWDRRRMAALLQWREAQSSLDLTNLSLGGISTAL
jgi:hypothetical protein